MEILKTKYGTYIIRLVKDEDMSLNIINDCFNSRLLLYHFPTSEVAHSYAIEMSDIESGEDLDNFINNIPEKYYMLLDVV